MLFAEIPGLQETKQKLIQGMRQNHLAHALLFHGQEGSATLPMALALATYVNCENPGEEDACGKCAACLKMNKLIHPDLNFTFPVPGSVFSSKKKDEEDEDEPKVDINKPWRTFLLGQPYGNLQDWIDLAGFSAKVAISVKMGRQIIKTLSLKSFEGGYKTMVIWQPELMNLQAANAILKILEEPPEKTLFLLVSSQPEQLLTTILSRTQKVSIRGFTDLEIKGHLVNKDLCNQQVADQLAPLADGNLRVAYRLVEEVKDESTTYFRDWMRSCYNAKLNEMLNHSEQFATLGKEGQKTLLLTGVNILRECLLDKNQLVKLMRSSSRDREFIGNFGKNVLSEKKILAMYELLNQSHYHLERYANPKITFLDLTFSLAKIIRMKETNEENHR
jgi:DNA polymerase III subunit delta'